MPRSRSSGESGESRRFAVLLEEIRDDVKRVAEGHGVLNCRFDTVDQRFDAVDQRFDAVERRLDAIERRLDALEQAVLELRVEIRTVTQRLEAHEQAHAT